MKLFKTWNLTQDSPASEAYINIAKPDMCPVSSQFLNNACQEAEMDSPYVCTHRDVSYSGTGIQLHSHNFYELLSWHNSSGAEFLVGSERYTLHKGDILSIPPGVMHMPLLAETMSIPCTRDVVWISEVFVDIIHACSLDFPREMLRTPFLFRTAGTKWEYLCEMIHKGVLEAENKRLGWNLSVSANTISILVELLRAAIESGASPIKAEKPELLPLVLTYIEDHLSERITLTKIAQHFYISESTVSQTFRKKMDISFYRYVTQRRLVEAKNLIESGSSLESVSEKVGFSDYSSFFRAFKQEYGISPRQYRKIHTN